MEIDFKPEEILIAYLKKVGENEKQFSHYDKKKIALLPFTTGYETPKEKAIKTEYKSFDGTIGFCFRDILGKDLPKELSKTSDKDQQFKEKLKNLILTNALNLVQYDRQHKEKLSAIVESVFFQNNNLLKYGLEAQLYMFWEFYDSGLKNIALFIREVFFNATLEKLIKDSSENRKHVFHALINKSLPKLIEKEAENKLNYHILDQKVVNCFQEDFKFLSEDKTSFLNESGKLFKFYFFSYVSSASLILNDFFEKKEHPIYFTLESESVSESRRTNESGWKMLESKSLKFFSHAVCLDLINHIPSIEHTGSMSYSDLAAFYTSSSEHEQALLIASVKSINEFYLNQAPKVDGGWEFFDNYHKVKKDSLLLKNEFESAIYQLYLQIDFQFEMSSRKSKRNAYAKWFLSFCKENMLKNRGRNGYSLSLNNEMLLFLTKLCVKRKEKMRLKDLWLEFKRRGIYFDDSTQQAIIGIYEKINLIEKKSDSGDAQYVRPIL